MKGLVTRPPMHLSKEDIQNLFIITPDEAALGKDSYWVIAVRNEAARKEKLSYLLAYQYDMYEEVITFTLRQGGMKRATDFVHLCGKKRITTV